MSCYYFQPQWIVNAQLGQSFDYFEIEVRNKYKSKTMMLLLLLLVNFKDSLFDYLNLWQKLLMQHYHITDCVSKNNFFQKLIFL